MSIPRLTLGIAAWSGAAIVLISSGPRTYQATTAAGSSTPPDVWVATGAEVAGLAVLVWLAVVALVTLAAVLPGAVGRSADTLARRIAPAVVTSLVRSGLGLGAGAVLGTSSMLALTAANPAVAVTAVSADHPWPSLDRATVAADAHRPEVYVVRPGDSLWDIAERALEARGARTTAADVARAWPAWWATNREVVGNHPELIHPGERLEVPAREGT